MTKLLLSAVMFALALLLSLDLRTASADGQEPVPTCEPHFASGGWLVRLCEDWELGVTCLHSDSGFMSCKWDN